MNCGPRDITITNLKRLFCPNCKHCIPRMYPLYTNQILQFQIMCKCTNYSPVMFDRDTYINLTSSLPKCLGLCSNNKHRLIASIFCIECNKWYCSDCINEDTSHKYHNKCISSFELNRLCPIHNDNIFYCRNCNKFHCKLGLECVAKIDSDAIIKNIELSKNLLSRSRDQYKNYWERTLQIFLEIFDCYRNNIFYDENLHNNLRYFSNIINKLPKDDRDDNSSMSNTSLNESNSNDIMNMSSDKNTNKLQHQNSNQNVFAFPCPSVKHDFLNEITIRKVWDDATIKVNLIDRYNRFSPYIKAILPLKCKYEHLYVSILYNEIVIINLQSKNKNKVFRFYNKKPEKDEDQIYTSMIIINSNDIIFPSTFKNNSNLIFNYINISKLVSLIEEADSKAVDLSNTTSITLGKLSIASVGLYISASIELKPDTILTATETGILSIWEYKNKQSSLSLTVSKICKNYFGKVVDIVKFEDNYILLASYNKGVILYNVENYNKENNELIILNKSAIQTSPHCLCCINKNKYPRFIKSLVLVGFVDGSVEIWEVEVKPLIEYSLKGRINAHVELVSKICFLNEGFFITMSDDKYIKIWDIETFTIVKEMKCEHEITAGCLIEGKEKGLLVGMGRGTYMLLDIKM